MRPAVEADRTGREITLTLRRDTLAGKRLVIDPGHGGKDSGAKGCGLQEKDITLLVATDLITKLTEAGALAFLTRDRDVFIPLPERPRLATVLGADAFVSIHCNAGDRPNQGHGTEAYYYTPQSLLLADMLQDSLVAGLGRRDNGVRQRHFAVLWRSPTPSSLVELMYIDCTGEGQLLCRPAVQQAAAQALFEALRAYFEGVQLTPEGEWPAGSLTPCPLPWQGRG
jgi:N-acetylmuramoyl-L-alanine amidase